MKVLSLFDGMACGMLAMQKVGIEVDRYVAFEIDKYATQTSLHNFPMIEQRGDVFHADFTEFSGFDFLIGGSPCTYWSIAQKNNRETEASGMGWELFSQYVRALHEAKPGFFVYENNKSMAKAIRASIDEAFGFEAICINSALVSAQNRNRLYWVGKRNEDGSYSKVPIEQPRNLGVLLKHILETGGDLTGNNKGYCLTASYDGACAWNTIERSQRTMVAEPVATTPDGKAFCLTANYSGAHVPHSWEKSVRSMAAEPVRVGTWPNNAKNQEHDSQQYRIYSTEGKAVTQCGNGGGLGAKTGLYAIPVAFEGETPVKAVSVADGKTYAVYEVKNGLITIKGKQYPIKLADGFYIIRKLTVRECMRLQTVPEWYEFPVSDTQAYKMLGNGWTVDVIAHILKQTKKDVAAE